MKQLSIIPDDGFVIVARERSQQKSEHIWIDNAGCVTLSRQVAKRFWKMPVLLIFKRGFTDICLFPAPEREIKTDGCRVTATISFQEPVDHK